MSTKHTPWPWRHRLVLPEHTTEVKPGVFKLPSFWQIDGELNGDGSASTLVATLPHYGNTTRMEADARLIAAAPDLLEALRKLAGIVSQHMEEHGKEDNLDGSPTWTEGDSIALSNARAAIAKATTTS